jgi:hypothetical protein
MSFLRLARRKPAGIRAFFLRGALIQTIALPRARRVVRVTTRTIAHRRILR